MSDPAAPAAFAWTGSRLAPWSGPDGADDLRVADSFRVADGTAVALDRHRARFLGSITSTGTTEAVAAAFWDAAVAALPRAGSWFPRLELRVDGELVVRVRPAPTVGHEVVLATHPDQDPRRHPLVKGPDLGRLQRVREAAVARGAGDAVLLDADGHVAETATAALVWWEGDALHAGAGDWLPSVTLALIADAAGGLTRSSRAPADLAGRELWTLNALHGVRPVIRWLDGPALAPADAGRLERMRRALEADRHPL